MENPDVLIAGAGPTGLVLALWLAQQGVKFRIIDRAPGPGRASRAMAVQARTLELYAQLGIADDVVEHGIKMQTVHLRETGREVAEMSVKDMGIGISPYPFVLCFPQDDHEKLLVEHLTAKGVQIDWNTELASFTQDDSAVHATLRTNGTESTIAAAYLCGCDGAHSVVRETLHLQFPGGTYDQLFYVADVRIAGGARNDLFGNLGANTFGLMLPVRSSGMHRLIGIMPDAAATKEKPEFEDIRAHVEPLFGIAVAEVNWFSTYHVSHRVAEHFRVGRCFLAGDAGHVHSPAGGQGMNTGIGDAINLAWKLAEVLHNRASPVLLDSYEAERIAFARKLVDSTDRLFTQIVNKGIGGELVRTWLVPRLMPFATQFAGVRRTIFRLISQVRIAYHKSPLSEGAAGTVRAGDRLPWVPPAGGNADNYWPLRAMNWQVHIYGEAEPAFAQQVAELGIPLHASPWSESTRQAGLARDAIYLIRPDGHVGLAMRNQNADRLRAYAHQLGLSAPALA